MMKDFNVQKRIIRVLPKGQITIPLLVRKQFHIEPDDVMELISLEDTLILKPIKLEGVDVVKHIRYKEWERYKDDIEKALLRLSKFPSKKLPKLCR